MVTWHQIKRKGDTMNAKEITVHEAASILNDNNRCLADFLYTGKEKINERDNVKIADVIEFIKTTPECEPFTD